MFNARYFNPRYFPERYFAKTGAAYVASLFYILSLTTASRYTATVASDARYRATVETEEIG